MIFAAEKCSRGCNAIIGTTRKPYGMVAYCPRCHKMGPPGKTLAEALQKWNERMKEDKR